MSRDRTEAGQKLAGELAAVVRRPAVVAAIPRGCVLVAPLVVERLRIPLTVVCAPTVTSRVAPELAFGALDENGEATLESRTVALLGLDQDGVERARTREAAEIRRRMTLHRVPPRSYCLPGATVVLVDDGLGTGLTMRAAVALGRVLAGPRRFEVVPRGDHLFEDREARARAAELTAAWLSTHRG
jgi:putative phosphoribosyl transferase